MIEAIATTVFFLLSFFLVAFSAQKIGKLRESSRVIGVFLKHLKTCTFHKGIGEVEFLKQEVKMKFMGEVMEELYGDKKSKKEIK